MLRPGHRLITLKMADFRRWKCNGMRPSSAAAGRPEGNNNKRGKRATMGNGNGEFPCSNLPGMPDSGNTTTVRGCFPPMDNGDRHTLHRKPVSPEDRPTLLLTTDGLGEWAMENGGRSPSAASPARDPAGMTNWARPMRLAPQWNGQCLPER